MKTERRENVINILVDVLELEFSERKAYLEGLNLSSETLAEVEALLELEEKSGDFMSVAAGEVSRDFYTVEPDEISLVGQKIGHFTIIGELGYGGMGAVYLAERTDGEFDQKVALKLLKREMNTAALRRRFLHERKILASLEHPNIARLLDAGTTDDKVPFLAMEYVEGLPINDFCEKNKLDLNQRLDLFRKVCAAVDFAHRNLIVHRDLKPSNILVNEDGEPKLLDFGISKILSEELNEADSSTITKLGVMTPSYASPEQLQHKSVTTATDIYSLGIILYELLSGHRPFEAVENDLKEIYKAVLENEPPPPSRILDSGFVIADFSGVDDVEGKSADSEKITAGNFDKFTNRSKLQTNPKSQIPNPKSLSGDLDNIVLKSLRKEPSRRYLSAENFAEDIHRHQRGLPVSARPNTFAYRAEKFFKRNKASVIAGSFIILAVFAGIAATLWQARIAQAEAEKAGKVNEYMRNILNFSNPMWVSSNPKRNRDAKVSDVLDEALKNIETDLANDPEIQAEILMTIAQTYTGQAQYDKALPLLQQAVEKFDRVHGENNFKSIQASGGIASIYFLTGKHSEAEELYRKTLNFYRTNPTDDENQMMLIVVDLNDFANIQNYKSNFAEAEKAYREAIDLGKKLSPKKRGMMPIVLGNLAWLLHSKGEFDEALKYYDQAWQEIRAAGNENELEAGTLFNKMGVAYNEMGNYNEAEIYYRKAYDILMKTVGEENFYTVSTMYRNAYNFYKQGKIEESEQLVNKSLEIQRKLFPKGHNLTAYSERLQGEIYTKKGDVKKGEEFLRKALEYLAKKGKEPNRDISLAKLSLGENLIAQNRFAEAGEFVNSALENSIKLVGENHPFTKQCREISGKIPTALQGK